MNKIKTVKHYLTSSHLIYFLLTALVLLSLIDSLVSHFLIRGGLGREGNPFLQNMVGREVFILIKVSGTLLCALILWDIYRRWPRLALISTWCFVGLYSGIVLWNISLFFITQL